MRHDTQSIEIDVPPRHAFEFLAQPENLPRWAAGFAKAIRRDSDAWAVTTPQGEVEMRYVTDPRLGVVDFHISPAPGVTTVAHSRVLPLGEGSVYVFTQEQTPGMPDTVFEGQVATLGRELRLLRSLLEVGSCGT